jgi:hypothetical protein
VDSEVVSDLSLRQVIAFSDRPRLAAANHFSDLSDLYDLRCLLHDGHGIATLATRGSHCLAISPHHGYPVCVANNPIFGDLVMTSYDRLVELDDGTSFPEKVEATLLPAGQPPLIQIAFEVRDGRPELVRFSIVSMDEPLSPAGIHSLPVGKIAKEAVRRIAIVVAVRAEADIGAGELAASSYRRRRGPVTDDELARVAEIVRQHPYHCRLKVAELLPTSMRTASRYIAMARDRGLLEEGIVE